MPEVTRQRTGELLRKLFEILIAHPEGLQARDALRELEARIQLTEYEQGFYESGARRFEKIVRFATVDCVKAGWMVKSKGRWSVTEAGKRAWEASKGPEDFYRKAVRLYHEWRAASRRTEAEAVIEQGEDNGEERTVQITFEQAEEQAWSEIEQYLQVMNPYDFQELVASLLQGMGYHVSWRAGSCRFRRFTSWRRRIEGEGRAGKQVRQGISLPARLTRSAGGCQALIPGRAARDRYAGSVG